MDHHALIEHYANGAEKLRQAIRGLTPEDLPCVPPADAKVGLWSIQQVIVHLLDSDLVASDRMKRVIAEDNPTLIGFDETKFAENLFYEEQPAEEAAALLEMNRKLMSRVLRKLPASASGRIGTHNQRGRLTLEQLLQGAVDHIEHHLKFIHAKRAWMGKELW
jgi:hypothetical protein